MKILFVGPATSLHMVRWINQLEGAGFDVHIFPVEPTPLHPKFRNVTLHHAVFNRRPFDEQDVAKLGLLCAPSTEETPSGGWALGRRHKRFDRSVSQTGWPWPFREGARKIEQGLEKLAPKRFSRAAALARTIRRIKPDLVHSLEMMTGGYLALAAKAELERDALKLNRKPPLGAVFPPWVLSNWGCDLQLFAQLAEHEQRARQIMAQCDYYSAECARDIKLARSFGFTGRALAVRPNASVFDLERVRKMRQPGPTSERRMILLKGYQDWHGRALIALQAMEKVQELLTDYKIGIYLAAPAVRVAAELMSRRTGIDVEFIPFSSHDHMMKLHGQSRISMGVSISDGIPSALLEAMAMGSFPIQSDTSCADEWITDGETGLLIPGEDVLATAEALRTALIDDDLVNGAAEANGNVAEAKMDLVKVRSEVAAAYRQLIEENRLRKVVA
ncbi:glycosyltransferase family 4 protein [Rhodospirillum sp. A1_3_36]|uniref:glycosyltransferase family 4 protein n=1 Tax=Rhodospirillum sp. A1_3_36 TaxID=3391666 RepID=UPI0039A64D55